MDGYVTIEAELDTKSFDAQIKSTEAKLQELEHLYESALKSKGKSTESEEAVRALGEEVEKTKNKLIDLKRKQDELNKSELSGISGKLSEVGNSMEHIIKKVTRWGLAVFGVRSAYMFIRQAMSSLSGYNEQIGADVQYIRFALATALQPVIEAIIKLAYKLLVYTAYIAKAWFGVNIFAKASSKAFGEANNKVKATNKSAKELSKTLAGFDEMNILQENGSVGTGGGGGGITAPSIDLSDWQNVKIPGWIEWIAKNRDLILGFLGDVVALIGAIKFAKLLQNLTGIFTIMRNMKGLALLGTIAGIAIALYGVYETIRNVLKWIGDPTWENFLNILDSLTTVIIGVGIAMVALNATNPIGWITLAIGAIGKLVTNLTKQKKSTDNLREAEKKLKDARKNLLSATDEYVDAVDNATEKQEKLREAQENTGISIDSLLVYMDKENKSYEDLTDKQKQVYKAYIDNENAQKNLEDSKKKVTTATKNEANASMDVQRELGKEKGKYDELKESIINNYEQGKISAKDARIQIAQAMDGMDEDAKRTFVQGIPNKIMSSFDSKKYQGKWNTFEYWWNKSLGNLKNTITLTITTKFNASVQSAIEKATAKIPKSAKGSIIFPTRIPKLASGGIVNMPGSGTYYRGATIGEAGAEAIVPLTDSQQMALLGETIGKYITVDLTNITNLDGRQIARKVEQINQNNKFVLNR